MLADVISKFSSKDSPETIHKSQAFLTQPVLPYTQGNLKVSSLAFLVHSLNKSSDKPPVKMDEAIPTKVISKQAVQPKRIHQRHDLNIEVNQMDSPLRIAHQPTSLKGGNHIPIVFQHVKIQQSPSRTIKIETTSPQGNSGDSTNFPDTLENQSKPSNAKLEDAQLDERDISCPDHPEPKNVSRIRKSCSGYYQEYKKSPPNPSSNTGGKQLYKVIQSDRSSHKFNSLSQLLLKTLENKKE